VTTEEFKKRYHESYLQKKAKSGMKFFPDVIYKDTLVMFSLFIVLVMLATFVGVAGEPKADPSDSAYIPRPEWYFLFLFEMLKYFPGQLEWIGTFIIPTIAVGVMFLLPFIDRNPYRHFSKRKIAISVMTVIVIGIVALTLMASASTPPQEETGTLAGTLPEQIIAGQDLYSVNCVECHGADGEGGEIKGVEGLEGFIMKAINTQDEMYTRTDETLYNIIAYGQPNLGMPPFGKAFGGELGPSDIDAIVTFMRYTWDDRAELPAEVTQASAVPTLAEGEVPSYEVHMTPIIKRYCISCHRPGKKNNNYLMRDYNEIMTTGDDAPNNVIPGDMNSNMIRMIHREEIEAGGPMPPTKALPPEIVSIFERWVAGGAPNTADEAAKASPGAVRAPGTVAPSGTLTTTVPLTGTLPLTNTVPLTGSVPLTSTVPLAPSAVPGTAQPTP
jgi:mono/diheme cytochrome c family protein